MAIKASFIPFSIPFTSADMPTRLDTPKMMPSIVSNERNLCAQISLRPMVIALKGFITGTRRDGVMESWSNGNLTLQHSTTPALRQLSRVSWSIGLRRLGGDDV